MQNSSSIVSNFEYLEKMAEQGDALALFRLGKCYSVGHGVTKDFEKAVDCFMSAAQQDNSYAQFELGLCYHHGIGVQEDAKKAFEWYEKAALQGNNIAQCHLGSCYQKGYGTVKNYGKAAQWYARSANQQNAKAFNNFSPYPFILYLFQSSERDKNSNTKRDKTFVAISFFVITFNPII